MDFKKIWRNMAEIDPPVGILTFFKQALVLSGCASPEALGASQRLDLPVELREHIEEDRTDQAPIRVVIVMHQPVPQAGDLGPGDLAVTGLIRVGKMIHLLPDVIQGGCDRPSNGLLLQDHLRRDRPVSQIRQQFFRCDADFFHPLLITVLHAIRTPSAKILR